MCSTFLSCAAFGIANLLLCSAFRIAKLCVLHFTPGRGFYAVKLRGSLLTNSHICSRSNEEKSFLTSSHFSMIGV